MRRLFVFVMACVLALFTASPGYSAVALDEETFPDATFRGYLAGNFDTDEDGILSNREILNIKEINRYWDERVRTYQGIKNLTSLERLETNDDDVLTELDLSGMTSLTYVEVYYDY